MDKIDKRTELEKRLSNMWDSGYAAGKEVMLSRLKCFLAVMENEKLRAAFYELIKQEFSKEKEDEDEATDNA